MKPIYPWGFANKHLDDPEMMKRIVAVWQECGRAGINGRWATKETLEKTMAHWDGDVCLTFLPYGSLKGELDIGRELDALWDQFVTCSVLADRVTHIFFDDVEKLHENTYPADPTPLYNLAYRLTSMYFRNALVGWYGSLDAPELRLDDAQCDFDTFRLYRPNNGVLTRAAAERAITFSDGRLIAYVTWVNYHTDPWTMLSPHDAYDLGCTVGMEQDSVLARIGGVALYPNLFDERVTNWAECWRYFIAAMRKEDRPNG